PVNVHMISRYKPVMMYTTSRYCILSHCDLSCQPNCSKNCTRLPRQIIWAQVSKNLWPKIFLTHTWCTVIRIGRTRAPMPNELLVAPVRAVHHIPASSPALQIFLTPANHYSFSPRAPAAPAIRWLPFRLGSTDWPNMHPRYPWCRSR